MSDEVAAALPVEDLPAPTTAEILTAEFYAWEMRGRGWQLWPYPVELEPPFRPFLEYVRPIQVVDDGRKPTLLSSLADALRRSIYGIPAGPVAPEDEFTEPEAAPYVADLPLVELQVSVPPSLRITKDAAEQFLLSLGYSSCPLGFEIVGTAKAVTVQFTCREPDRSQLVQQLKGYFPEAVVRTESGALERLWDLTDAKESVVVDFGLSGEFMLPLRTFRGFEVDPLIAAAGALSDLADGEVGVLQVLFQSASSAWAPAIMQAVTDSEGRSFFADAPHILPLAKEKVTRPLSAAVIRVAMQSPHHGRAWQITKALAGTFQQFADPQGNELIPLDDEGYDQTEHLEDLIHRRSRRSGMLLNTDELVSLVHLPSASVRAEKLERESRKAKAAPAIATGHRLVLGENPCAGRTTTVTLSPEQRARHMYVVGASGTGKSTLLLNLIVQDMRNGEGLAVLDPHGDLIDQVLGFVPDERIEDVILLDPSDTDYPIGLNLLSAHSPLEKNLLASDLVAVFRRLSTSWGDQMTSVLGNAVMAFLESDRGGTLADLRRFLVEPEYRRAFLETVRDSEAVYYWQKEFPLLTGRPQAPILTRLDTFLRPKAIRHMVAQKEDRLDFAAMLNQGKILLARLAQGAIGEENAYLLGTLLVSKFHQLATSRQEMSEAERRPFYLYIDEFHHFATPSMAAALAGARKYRLGLILAHQDLRQLGDSEVASAVLTNPCTRVCFRVGDLDARRLADGFTTFDAKDLQTLGLGEAICRVERADYDFNLRTLPLPGVEASLARHRRDRIVAQSRAQYCTPRADMASVSQPVGEPDLETPETAPPAVGAMGPEPARNRRTPSEADAEPEASLRALPGRGGPQHKYLQSLVKRLAEERGFAVKIEKPVLGGHGHVDVALERTGCSVACEISVTTRVAHEVQNLTKCIAAGFDYAVLLCPDGRVLKAARHLLADADQERLRFLHTEDLIAFLDQLASATDRRDDTLQGSAAPKEKRAGDARTSVELKKRLLVATDAAAYIGLATQTLAKMRVTGDSPPFYKVGRQVLYDRTDLDKWLGDRRRRSTSDGGQRD